MFLAVVIGDVIATQRDANLENIKLLLIQPIDMVTWLPNYRPIVATDAVSAGIGSVVLYVDSREAAWAYRPRPVPTDATIVGIVDKVEVEKEAVVAPPVSPEEVAKEEVHDS